jgi:hypothetical protein
MYFAFFSNTFQDIFFKSITVLESSNLVTDVTFFYNLVLSDYVNKLSVFDTPYLHNWYNNFYSEYDLPYLYYYHPELFFSKNSVVDDYILSIISKFRPVLSTLCFNEVVGLAVMLFPQYLFILACVGLLFILYFNYYSSSTKEENISDHDFLILNSGLDAEEEIGSLDDILFGFLVFFYVFS